MTSEICERCHGWGVLEGLGGSIPCPKCHDRAVGPPEGGTTDATIRRIEEAQGAARRLADDARALADDLARTFARASVGAAAAPGEPTEKLMQALADARAAYSTGGIAGAAHRVKHLFDVCDEVGIPARQTQEDGR